MYVTSPCIHLHDLSSIFSSSFSHIKAEELFDDIEEEFAIAAKKKPAAFGGGKNAATEKAKPVAKPVVEVMCINFFRLQFQLTQSFTVECTRSTKNSEYQHHARKVWQKDDGIYC